MTVLIHPRCRAGSDGFSPTGAGRGRAPLPVVRTRIDELRSSVAIVTCKLTRYEGERTIEVWECRVSGYAQKPAPGRKAKKAA